MRSASGGLPPSVTRRLTREVGQGVVLLALTGASVGGLLAMATMATRALGG